LGWIRKGIPLLYRHWPACGSDAAGL